MISEMTDKTFDRGEWQATIDMNKWLEDKNIDVISVETIFEVSGSMASTSSRFEAIRLVQRSQPVCLSDGMS